MNIRHSITGLLCGGAVLLGLSAAAQTPGPQTQTSPQSQTGPQTSSPAASSPASTQSSTTQSTTTSTAGTEQSSSPAATPGQAGANAPQGHPGSVEEALQLTPEQKSKLQPIIQEEVTQINSVRNDASLSMDQKRSKIEEIKKTSFPKILAVLTPEQQKKLADMQQQARQQQQQRQMNQGPSASPATPDASQPSSGAGAGQPGMGHPGSQPGMPSQPSTAPGSTPPGSQPPQ